MNYDTRAEPRAIAPTGYSGGHLNQHNAVNVQQVREVLPICNSLCDDGLVRDSSSFNRIGTYSCQQQTVHNMPLQVAQFTPMEASNGSFLSDLLEVNSIHPDSANMLNQGCVNMPFSPSDSPSECNQNLPLRLQPGEVHTDNLSYMGDEDNINLSPEPMVIINTNLTSVSTLSAPTTENEDKAKTKDKTRAELNEAKEALLITEDRANTQEIASSKQRRRTELCNSKKVTSCNNKTYICKICNKELASARGLKRHEPMHYDQMPYPCNLCEKGFAQQGSLINHKNGMHATSNFYSCSQCDKSFTRKSGLKSHMESHSDDMKYTCNICTKGFKHKCNYKMHCKAHGNSTKKALICEFMINGKICGMISSSSSKFEKHQKTHSKLSS